MPYIDRQPFHMGIGSLMTIVTTCDLEIMPKAFLEFFERFIHVWREVADSSANTRVQAEGVSQYRRVIVDIRIKVHIRIEPPWVLAEKLSDRGIVVSGAVVVETSLGIEFAGRVLERISERAVGGDLFAKGIERVGLGERAGGVGQRSDRAEPVRLVVARHGGARFRQGLVDVPPVGVSGHYRARRIHFLNETVTIVGVDACATRRRFVDAPAEGIVFEADSSAGTG